MVYQFEGQRGCTQLTAVGVIKGGQDMCGFGDTQGSGRLEGVGNALHLSALVVES